MKRVKDNTPKNDKGMRKIKDEKSYDFDYNDIVEKGYILNNSDASLELLELLADFSIYEGYDGENWTSKVRDVLQEYMDTLPQGMVMSNYGEKFYSADELPQWSALEILQTKIFAKEMRMNDQEAVKKIGEYFNLDFNIEPFSSFVEKYANIDGYFDRYYQDEVSDSRKIKDADETQDVLDGILMIAFNDGSEEEGYNEVKKHANEQGELDGVQYETYDVDNQDGVTLIDLCAATDDANAFVKALLTEWGVIDAVADIEFEKSELMENAEEGGEEEQVSDSLKSALAKGALKLLSSKIGKWAVKEVGKYLLEKGFEKLTGKSDNDKEVYESEDGDEIEVSYKDGKLDKVSDSKVEDMTKPAHLRGYAEKYRKKRREQREETNEDETKQEVNDSKTIKNGSTMKSNRVSDSLEDDYEEYLNEIGEDLDEDEFIIGGKKRNMPYGTALRKYDPIAFNVGFDEWEREMEDDKEQILGQIATQLEEGYRSGYDPQWDIDITVDNGMDISDFSDEDKDLIYQDIAYVVKDGYDNYMDIETELSDGSIVYVDFVLNY